MSTLQTLDRGLTALDVISQRPAGISIAELAVELGVHRAICYRIVSTLLAHALVARTGDGRIRLGAGTAVLASRFEPQLWHSAGPLLHRLANEAQATAYVSVAHGDECIVVMVAEPELAVIRVGYRVGSRHALDRGAAGLAILAARPEQPTDSERVKKARVDGYNLTVGELERGAVGIAAPIRPAAEAAGVTEASVGVVAIDGLDTERAAKVVLKVAQELRWLADV